MNRPPPSFAGVSRLFNEFEKTVYESFPETKKVSVTRIGAGWGFNVIFNQAPSREFPQTVRGVPVTTSVEPQAELN